MPRELRFYNTRKEGKEGVINRDGILGHKHELDLLGDMSSRGNARGFKIQSGARSASNLFFLISGCFLNPIEGIPGGARVFLETLKGFGGFQGFLLSV